MSPTNTNAAIRHALTFLGGILAAKGLASDAEIQEAVGALMALATVGWSIWEKHHVRRALAAGSTPEPQPPAQ